MFILDLALLLAGILSIAFLLAPSVRSGSVNITVAAASVAGLMGASPVLFAVTGVLVWDAWFVIFATGLLFTLGFLSGRAMAATMLGSHRD